MELMALENKGFQFLHCSRRFHKLFMCRSFVFLKQLKTPEHCNSCYALAFSPNINCSKSMTRLVLISDRIQELGFRGKIYSSRSSKSSNGGVTGTEVTDSICWVHCSPGVV